MIAIPTRLKPVINQLNRFSVGLFVLALGWLAWTAARLLWLILAPPTAPALPLQPLQNQTASGADYAAMFAIFADPEPVTQEVQPPNVALKGVLLAMPERLSSALLEVNGEVKNYRIGDDLQDSGYTLIAVDWNAVIITDAANQQIVIRMADSMALDQSDMAAGQMSNQRLPDDELTALPASPMPDTLADDENPAFADGSAASSAEPNNMNDSDDSSSVLDEAVTQLRESPASYLSRMGVMAAGEGYQVTAAMPEAVRNRLGLEPGDRVLTVNGQNIGSDPTQDAGLLQQIKQAGEAQIEVQRGEQVITIRQQF